jgi:hypothetical protein
VSAIDFPSSPSTGASFAAGSRLWRFDGARWELVSYSVATPTEGVVDGGASSTLKSGVKVNGGVVASNFSGTVAINGGAP